MEKKLIGTITFHVAHNYGAMLQAYALPIAVNELGYQCEVIDYRFPYIYNWGVVESRADLINKYGLFWGLLRWFKRLIKGIYNPQKKINKFNFFRENCILHSTEIYSEKNELNNMNYDAILFGSDQVWNEELTNGLATEFFGEFPCLKKTKKIAYAASCGKNDFNPQYKSRYINLLKNFSALGIREQGLVDALEKDGLSATRVLDPTLLIDRKKWDELIQTGKQKTYIIAGDYILVYAFDENDSLYTFIDELAEKEKLKVVVITYNKKDIIKKYCVLDECGPIDFVSLIANAKIVISTSFHGTVFSLLYNKEFYCIPHPIYHERTDSLLNMVNLNDRNIIQYEDFNKVKPIKWDDVNKILESERIKSIEFLKQSIEE